MQLKVVRLASRCACGLAAAAIVLALASPAAAGGNYTWDPLENGALGDASGVWNSTNANWWWQSGGWGSAGVGDFTSPTNGYFNTIFGGATAGNGQYTVTVQGSQYFYWMFFDNSGYTLTGGSLAMQGNSYIFFNPAATIASDIVGNGSLEFSCNNPTTGMLTLSGTNAWTGGTTIQGCTVSFASTASLPGGTAPQPVTFNGGFGPGVLAVQPGNGVTGWSGAEMTALANHITWSSNGSFGIDTTNGNYTLDDGSGVNLPAGAGLAKVGANTMILAGA